MHPQYKRIKKAVGSGGARILATRASNNGRYANLYDDSWFYEPKFIYNGVDFPNHWIKLDFLFCKCLEAGASQDDIVVFLDGDAFPLGTSFCDRMSRILETKKFCFIKERTENKPHCGFFACKVSDWSGKSWCPGPFDCTRIDGKTVIRKEIDIGGPLSYLLNTNTSCILDRCPPYLHRSLLQTYGNDDGPIAYHHCAGFRRRKIHREDVILNRNRNFQHKKNVIVSEDIFSRIDRGEDLWIDEVDEFASPMFTIRESSILSWKNCRKGETAWILGSGPSLDELDPSQVGENRFALNLTILMDKYRSSWWVCRDGRCMKKWIGSNRHKAIGEDRRQVDLLFTDKIGNDRIRSLKVNRKMIREIVNSGEQFRTGETVLVYALQVADYMGFSDIILAGIDLCDPEGVAYAEEINWQHHFTIKARAPRYKRMRKEVSYLSTALNARVRTVSPHLQDIFEKVDI